MFDCIRYEAFGDRPKDEPVFFFRILIVVYLSWLHRYAFPAYHNHCFLAGANND